MGKIAFFVFALFLSSVAQAESRPESEKFHIFLLGDSQSLNLRASLATHAKGKYSFDSLGKQGTTAKWWIQHERLIRSKLAKKRPDLTIIVLGTNDGVTKKRAERANESFPALVKLMRTFGNKQVVWVTPPEVPNVPYLPQIRETAKGLDCMVADFSGKNYPLRRKGNFHLSVEGYRLWSADLVEKLKI
jgi:lysophospholipase L1-like esterase